jgi:diguanylate cyclase (GGDEF)-like protein/PAS domain S-box-containing protein
MIPERGISQTLLEYQAILENASVGILFTRNRRVLHCNPRFAEIFGWPQGELAGKPGSVFYPSEEAYQEVGRTAAPILAAGKSYDAELTMARRDGSPFLCHLIAKAINPARTQAGTIYIAQDITERKHDESALRQLLLEQSAILDNVLIGIAFVKERRVVRCNRRFEELLGCARGEMIGRSTRAFYLSDRDYEEVGEVYEQLARGEVHSREQRLARKDGGAFWCRISGRAVEPADPAEGTVWLFEDISARREAEQALTRSRDELEDRVRERTAELAAAYAAVEEQLHFRDQLLEAMPNPVFYKDEHGRYLGCNAAWSRLTGLSRHEHAGRSDAELFPAALAREFAAGDRELAAEPGGQVREVSMEAAAGEPCDLLISKAAFSHQDGSPGGLVGVVIDITERKRMEARLRQAATVFESSAEGVLIVDRELRIVAANKAFTRITGYTEAEALGRSPRMLSSGRHDAAFYDALWQTVAGTGTWQGEVWNRRKNGEVYPEWLTISQVLDECGAITHYVGIFSDITLLKRSQEKLDYQAHHDPLTDLPNRLLFEDRLNHALQRARREKTQLAVLFVDLDRFKNINDTLGHPVGDRVLQEIGKRLGAALRDADTVARLGGDEFIILLEDVVGERDVAVVAEKLLEDFRRPIAAQGQEFYVTASIGASLYPRDGDDVATLVKNADAAMYRAKERGRNSYEFYTVELTWSALERLSIETSLRRALERGELRLFLQPQYGIRSGRLTGAEALLRWQHPERGLVQPQQFVQMAEETGLIVPIGEWILHRACEQARAWLDAGQILPRVAVNVSAMQFRRGAILDTVAAVLRDTRLPPERLELEITESNIMKQAEEGIDVLLGLRKLGVRLAIDDFGTGYSSLSYLKRLPVDNLKIDQGFVRELPQDSDDAAIARAVIALAHGMELGVIAEGVETEAQRSFLESEGCDEVQGFLLGRPAPAADFGRLMQSQIH